MYKVYKHQKISIGMPKPLLNTFNNKETSKVMEEDEINSMNVKNEEEYEKIIKEAHEMYASIIEEANEEAQRIIKEKCDEIELLKKKELDDAYDQGFKKGYEEAKVVTQSIINEAKSIKEFLEQRKKNILKEAEEEVVELILNISRKIIGDELQQNKNVIISQIKLALEKCTYRNKISIKVSSADYPNVLANKEIIESLVEGISELEIIEDKSLKNGDCIIDTPSGEINSSIELQMEELKKAFYFVLRNEWRSK